MSLHPTGIHKADWGGTGPAHHSAMIDINWEDMVQSGLSRLGNHLLILDCRGRVCLNAANHAVALALQGCRRSAALILLWWR